ncbi:hypothetical protein C2S52_010395 [Perilla frutescens var. hirtella]|nr:hypothetical protein C2S52_010395 [Perilla frutescens var. hirtella]KAH6817243.1 hypothetical protein C2S51_000846 [Perilla frutescens var. frutescens]
MVDKIKEDIRTTNLLMRKPCQLQIFQLIVQFIVMIQKWIVTNGVRAIDALSPLQCNFLVTSLEVRRLSLSTFKVKGMHCEMMHSLSLSLKKKLEIGPVYVLEITCSGYMWVSIRYLDLEGVNGIRMRDLSP